MNKLSMIVFSLMLSACVTAPDLRPNPYLKSEELLQQGLSAYEKDDFSLAQQKFSRALELYKSFDNHWGIALSQLNLGETALATSDFASAELYLTALKQQSIRNELESELQHKVVVLGAKLQFEQQHYQAALATLKPLLAELDGQKKTDDEWLNLLAMQARLDVLISPLETSTALARFETALAQTQPQPPLYQALLNRTLAVIALNRKDYQTAAALATQALAYHKAQANRRAIASCLEELANIETARQAYQAAESYLHRALVIRQWLKNEYKSGKIREQLLRLKQSKL